MSRIWTTRLNESRQIVKGDLNDESDDRTNTAAIAGKDPVDAVVMEGGAFQGDISRLGQGERSETAAIGKHCGWPERIEGDIDESPGTDAPEKVCRAIERIDPFCVLQIVVLVDECPRTGDQNAEEHSGAELEGEPEPGGRGRLSQDDSREGADQRGGCDGDGQNPIGACDPQAVEDEGRHPDHHQGDRQIGVREELGADFFQEEAVGERFEGCDPQGPKDRQAGKAQRFNPFPGINPESFL